jgi:serine/threonine-protein kinase
VLVALLTAAAVALAVLVVVLDRRADSAGDDVTEAADRLLALALPGDLAPGDCTAEEPGDGELRRLTCPDGDDDTEVPDGTHTLHADDGGEQALQAEVDARGLARLDDVFDCGSGDTPQGWLRLTDFDEVQLGSLACYVDDEGDAVLAWTWDDLGSYSVVELRGGGEDGLGDLRNWWGDNADRGI